MENSGVWDPTQLVDELAKGHELTRQLGNHLDQSCPPELLKPMAQSILACLENSMAMAKLSHPVGEQHAVDPASAGSDSPRSASDSPHSASSEQAFKDQERRELTKKRKALPKWTSQIRVGLGPGLEGPQEDEYSWRKYGQKDILGAKYPRAYYRCTHQKSQGCLATKQMQRSDENPSIFDVTYRGKHTCFQRPHLGKTSAAPIFVEQPQDQNSHQDPLLSFKTNLKVKTEGLEPQDDVGASSSSPFAFPWTPVVGPKAENIIFSSPLTLENQTFSPLLSPTFHMGSFGGGASYPRTSESDLKEIVSVVTSTINSPVVGLDYQLEQVEFNPNFPFDNDFFM